MRIIILSIIMVFYVGCNLIPTQQTADNSPKDITISSVYDTKLGKEITFDDFIQKLYTYDIVMLGERHDNKSHHIAQEKILKELSKEKKVNLVLEMFSTDMQKTIDSAYQNKQNIKPNTLQKEIGWDKKWDYTQYKDIMQTAFFSDNITIKGGNISRDEITTIYEGVQPLKGVLSTTDKVKQELAKIIMQTHHIDDKEVITKLVEIQQYKDRRMADVLVNADGFCVLLAGHYHVSKSVGVPLHIKDFQSKKKVAVVSMSNATQENKIDSDFVVLLK